MLKIIAMGNQNNMQPLKQINLYLKCLTSNHLSPFYSSLPLHPVTQTYILMNIRTKKYRNFLGSIIFQVSIWSNYGMWAGRPGKKKKWAKKEPILEDPRRAWTHQKPPLGRSYSLLPNVALKHPSCTVLGHPSCRQGSHLSHPTQEQLTRTG